MVIITDAYIFHMFGSVIEIFLKGMFSLMAEPILAGPGREDTAMLAGSQSLKLKATRAAASKAPRDKDGASLTGTWPLACCGSHPPACGPPPKAVGISSLSIQVPGSGQGPLTCLSLSLVLQGGFMYLLL